MLIILPSRTLTIWPQPTAQYGQTLGTSLAPLILRRRVSSRAARRSPPKPSRPPRAKPPAEVLRNSRRVKGVAAVCMASVFLGANSKAGSHDKCLLPISLPRLGREVPTEKNFARKTKSDGRQSPRFVDFGLEQVAQFDVNFLRVGCLDDGCVGLGQEVALQAGLEFVDDAMGSLSQEFSGRAADARGVLHDEVVVLQVGLGYAEAEDGVGQQLALIVEASGQLAVERELDSHARFEGAVPELRSLVPSLVVVAHGGVKRKEDGEGDPAGIGRLEVP